MEKMVNKERSPLSHGTAAAISMNLKSKTVALGIRVHPPILSGPGFREPL